MDLKGGVSGLFEGTSPAIAMGRRSSMMMMMIIIIIIIIIIIFLQGLGQRPVPVQKFDF
jgi:uncharacterized membrane protein